MTSNFATKLTIALAIWVPAMTGAFAEGAEWTLMVYMNGKNNLEADAIRNFHEMAVIGGSPKVNVVVEFGRPRNHVTGEAENWEGVLRFEVKKGQQPIPSMAVADLRDNPALSDMGSSAALDDFISWSVGKYPAKKYMLVIWNHGQGWRFQMADDPSLRVAARHRIPSTDRDTFTRLNQATVRTPIVGGYRAVSFDDDTGNVLYNSDVQQSLAKIATRLQRKLDVVGFDACLMSMLETAYGLRNSAALMVGSEELEPGPGWDYTSFLRPLAAHPEMSPFDLSKAVIVGYKARYDYRYPTTTLSVIDLSKASAAASSVSALADSLRGELSTERSAVQTARSKLTPYGAGDGLYTSIDLPAFLELYIGATSNNDLRRRAQVALDAAVQTVLENYASADSTEQSGSRGIAIYFPANRADFESDPYNQGYVKSNTDHSVEFVARERWADFLNSYLQ